MKTIQRSILLIATILIIYFASANSAPCIIVFSDMVFRRICGKFNFRRVAIFAVCSAKGLGDFLQRNIKSVGRPDACPA